MMYVKTTLGPSKIHGIGIFADEPIPKGTLIWKYLPGFDLKFSDEQIANLPDSARAYLKTYSYRSRKSGLHILPVDNGRHFNHSENPNTSSEYSDVEEEVVTRAVKNISPGEEMTENYGAY